MTAALLLMPEHPAAASANGESLRHGPGAPVPLAGAPRRVERLVDVLRALARGWASECLVCGTPLEPTAGAQAECGACGSSVGRPAARGDDQLALL